MVFLGAGFNYA